MIVCKSNKSGESKYHSSNINVSKKLLSLNIISMKRLLAFSPLYSKGVIETVLGIDYIPRTCNYRFTVFHVLNKLFNNTLNPLLLIVKKLAA